MNVTLWQLTVAALMLLPPQLMAQSASSSPRRDINAVLAAHDQALLALPDVAGVYVGTLKDGRTPCLHVMLARKNVKTERAIPRRIEGYTVVIEVTGEIRALDGH